MVGRRYDQLADRYYYKDHADLNMTKLKPMMGGPLRWTGSNIHGE